MYTGSVLGNIANRILSARPILLDNQNQAMGLWKRIYKLIIHHDILKSPNEAVQPGELIQKLGSNPVGIYQLNE